MPPSRAWRSAYSLAFALKVLIFSYSFTLSNRYCCLKRLIRLEIDHPRNTHRRAFLFRIPRLRYRESYILALKPRVSLQPRFRIRTNFIIYIGLPFVNRFARRRNYFYVFSENITSRPIHTLPDQRITAVQRIAIVKDHFREQPYFVNFYLCFNNQ